MALFSGSDRHRIRRLNPKIQVNGAAGKLRSQIQILVNDRPTYQVQTLLLCEQPFSLAFRLTAWMSAPNRLGAKPVQGLVTCYQATAGFKFIGQCCGSGFCHQPLQTRCSRRETGCCFGGLALSE